MLPSTLITPLVTSIPPLLIITEPLPIFNVCALTSGTSIESGATTITVPVIAEVNVKRKELESISSLPTPIILPLLSFT